MLSHCYQLRTSFLLTFREELPTRQGITSTPVPSVLLGAGSDACNLRVTPATGLVNPAGFLAVTLRPRFFLALRLHLLLNFYAVLARENSRSPKRLAC